MASCKTLLSVVTATVDKGSSLCRVFAGFPVNVGPHACDGPEEFKACCNSTVLKGPSTSQLKVLEVKCNNIKKTKLRHMDGNIQSVACDPWVDPQANITTCQG